MENNHCLRHLSVTCKIHTQRGQHNRFAKDNVLHRSGRQAGSCPDLIRRVTGREPQGFKGWWCSFLIGILLAQVRWCYGKLLRLIVTPWALCCEYTKFQYEGHNKDIGWCSFIGLLALMRVTNTESLLTPDHVSRRWREVGCTVKARWGRDLFWLGRGRVHKEARF